jgi:hypothetical protein
VCTFLAHGVTDAPHQQAKEKVARLKLQEQLLLLEISDLCAALQNTQKLARRERKAMQQHVERHQARLLLEEKCAHFKALSVRQEMTVTELRNENTALLSATAITADSLVTLAPT